MTDELADLKNELSQLRCLINTNASIARQTTITLANNTGTNIKALAHTIGITIQAQGESLTSRMVDVDAKLRKKITALGDKTDAEIAALAGRVDTFCAGC